MVRERREERRGERRWFLRAVVLCVLLESTAPLKKMQLSSLSLSHAPAPHDGNAIHSADAVSFCP
jgi:hypothetical protein